MQQPRSEPNMSQELLKSTGSMPGTKSQVQELRRLLVQIGWISLLLAPVLYWIQGPAVSSDQFVVRVLIVCLAAFGVLSALIWPRGNLQSNDPRQESLVSANNNVPN